MQSQNNYEKYEKGVYCLLANNVNIRRQPSTHSKVVANLPIASKIHVIEKCKEQLTLNGVTANWLKITFTQNNTPKPATYGVGLLPIELKNRPPMQTCCFYTASILTTNMACISGQKAQKIALFLCYRSFIEFNPALNRIQCVPIKS